MTGKELVREVICLFKGGERWTKGTYIQDDSGRTLSSPNAEKGVKFCLLGAAHRVLGLDSFRNVSDVEALCEFSERVRDSLPKATRSKFKANGSVGASENPGDYVVAFNDSMTTDFDTVERVLAKALIRKHKTKAKKKQATA